MHPGMRLGMRGAALASRHAQPATSRQRLDIIVIGASVVYHRAALGAGTTAQSSGILRTHCSLPQNVDLGRRSWAVFERFAEYRGDNEASAGLVRCGYLIATPAGRKRRPVLRAPRADVV